MKKFRFALAAVLTLSLALGACSSTKKVDPSQGTTTDNSKTADSNATFKYYQVDKPTTFDPAMVSDVTTMQVIGNVFSGLVQYNEQGELVNDMAADIKVSDDGKTYTFTLKDNIKFHDGSPVTAEDFKKTLVRNMNPALASPVNDTYLDDITGYNKFLKTQAKLSKDFKAKTITEDEQKKQLAAAYEELKKAPGIEAKDPKTLVIKIVELTPYFLAKMTYPTAYPAKNLPEDKALAASPANAKLMIGAGPFKMDNYVESSSVVLKRNDDFYGQKAKVATVEIPVITSDQAQLAAYRAGQIDMTPIPPADYKTIKADKSIGDIMEFAGARVDYLALNQGKLEAAKDVRVRQAIAMGIDNEALSNVVFNGAAVPAYGVLPNGIPGALGDKIQGNKFNVAKAKELLKAAGYGEGAKPLTFKISYRAKNETNMHVAEFIQNQLKTNLGLTVQIEPVEWSALLQATDAKNQLDAFLLGWTADYIDPQDFLTILLHTDAPYNRYGYANKEMDAILDKADHAKAGPERIAEYGKAEQIAVSEAGFVPLYFRKNAFVVRSKVKGVRHNVMGILPLNTVEYTK